MCTWPFFPKMPPVDGLCLWKTFPWIPLACKLRQEFPKSWHFSAWQTNMPMVERLSWHRLQQGCPVGCTGLSLALGFQWIWPKSMSRCEHWQLKKCEGWSEMSSRVMGWEVEGVLGPVGPSAVSSLCRWLQEGGEHRAGGARQAWAGRHWVPAPLLPAGPRAPPGAHQEEGEGHCVGGGTMHLSDPAQHHPGLVPFLPTHMCTWAGPSWFAGLGLHRSFVCVFLLFCSVSQDVYVVLQGQACFPPFCLWIVTAFLEKYSINPAGSSTAISCSYTRDNLLPSFFCLLTCY